MRHNYCALSDKRKLFSDETETNLAKHVTQLPKVVVRAYQKCHKLAFELALQNNITTSHSWIVNKLSGKDWCANFMTRQTTSLCDHQKQHLWLVKLLLINTLCKTHTSQ